MSDHFLVWVSGWSWFSAEPEPMISHEDACGLATGRVRPSAPHVFVQNSVKSRPGPFSFGGSPHLRLVSNELIAAFQQAQATGWSTYPIDLRTTNGKAIPGFTGLAVSGRAGAILPEAGVPFGSYHLGRKGLVFEDGTWDGSDLFIPERSASVLCTNRVRQAVRAAKIRGLTFEALADVEYTTDQFG